MPWQAERRVVENLLGGRGSVLLGPVPITHHVLHHELDKYLPNIDTILRAALPCVSKTGFRTQDGSKVVLKLIHNFFKPRPHPLQGTEPAVPGTNADTSAAGEAQA